MINGETYYKVLHAALSGGKVSHSARYWVRVNDSFEAVQYSFRRQSDVLMLHLDASVGDTWQGYEPLRSADFFYDSENWILPPVVLRDRGQMRDLYMHIDFLEDEREALRFVYALGPIENSYSYVDGIGAEMEKHSLGSSIIRAGYGIIYVAGYFC